MQGGPGNVTGYRINRAGRLTALPGASRGLGLTNDSRPEFLTAPADIAQTADGAHVIVTTKANNDIDVFNVHRGLSAPVKNHAASPVPFAVSFTSTHRLAVANAGNSSVSTYTVNADGTLDTITAGVEDGQAALCWLVGTGDTFFGGNAGNSTISAFAVDAAGNATLTGATGRSRRAHRRWLWRHHRPRHHRRPAIPVRGEQLRRIRRGVPDPARPHAAVWSTPRPVCRSSTVTAWRGSSRCSASRDDHQRGRGRIPRERPRPLPCLPDGWD